MNTVTVTNITDHEHVLGDLRSFTVAVSGTVDLLNYFSAEEVARSDDLLVCLADEHLIITVSGDVLTPGRAIRYVSLHKHVNPLAPDGREIIRADSRPVGTQTYFTMSGDSATGIGDGGELRWDFSNDDYMYDSNDVENGPTVASGIKAKRLDIEFHEPIHTKDGAVYFFDAPWGSYCEMFITVPAGNYYPNPAGSIPAAALGLSGTDMYAYATKDVFYGSFIQKHYMYETCAMGDDLNSEGSQVDATPTGWYITGLIFTPESDNVSKGYASLEIYRKKSVLLPGESV